MRVCTICARSGSKGVKNKNIRTLAGKPLIAHSILQARSTGLFDIIAVSSDSRLILDTAMAYGIDYAIERPLFLATDIAPKIPVIQHCVADVEERVGYHFDTVVDLDATSPLRSLLDIAEAIKLLEDRKASNVITGTPARRSPYFNLVEVNKNGVVHLSKNLPMPINRRQDAPPCYDMNASIYVWKRDFLFNSHTLFNSDTLLYEMPEERSVDIDSPLDFEYVEFLMTRKRD